MRDDGPMTPLRREPLAEQVADALLERIRRGEWAVGERLPGETTLAPDLGVGRSTIREAIRHLAGRGVLATRQGAGVFVTALEPSDDWDAVLARAGVTAVIEARIAIEVEASALAAERRSPNDLRVIERALGERTLHRGDLAERVDADTAFHRSIVVAARNPILTELFDGFAPRSRQAMVEMLRLRGEDLAPHDETDQETHVRIVEAIADRDPAVAAARTRAHLLTLGAQLPSGSAVS